MKTKTIHTDKKDMERTHTNCCDNSKHSLRLIRRKELQIVVTLDELFLFVAYWTMIPIFFPQIPIFCWSDPDFSFQLSGRSGNAMNLVCRNSKIREKTGLGAWERRQAQPGDWGGLSGWFSKIREIREKTDFRGGKNR